MHRTLCSRGVTLITVLSLGLSLLSPVSLGEPIISASQIDMYLLGKSSPLVGNGPSFISNGLTFDVDPRLIVAIAGAETTFGLRLCGDFNAWNWFWCYAFGTCGDNPCANSPFASWEEGIATVTKFIRLKYLNRGLTTIPQIAKKYCTEGCENWVPNVTRFYQDELGGDTTNLGFSGLTSTPSPPTPVTLLRLYPQYTTANYLGVFWSRNNDSDFARYQLHRATHPGVTTADQLVSTVTENTAFSFYFRDNNLVAGTYYYKVFTFNSAGGSAGSNELSGRVFAPGEVISRIPGVPEPGDTTFASNVAIPNSVLDELRFDCTAYIAADPASGACAGTFTAIGPVIDSFGHVSKFRFFPLTTIQGLSLNGIQNFQFIVHQADIFDVSLFAQDDTYTFVQSDFGFNFTIPQGGQQHLQFGANAVGTFQITLRNSSGSATVAGSFILVP